MTRQRFSLFLLALALGATAGLQTACAESDNDQSAANTQAPTSTPASTDAAATDAAEPNAPAPTAATQVAANEPSATEAQTDAAGGGQTAADQPYQVSCDGNECTANQAVVTGYLVYGKHCHRCHGADARGSSFAPSLVKRLKNLKKGEFIAIVANGKTSFNTTTQGYRVMPSWKSNADVMGHITDLWAYLLARSDGALPPVRPEPMQ